MNNTEMKNYAKQVYERAMKEQELIVAKFLLDNPDADMTKVRLVSYWSVDGLEYNTVLRYEQTLKHGKDSKGPLRDHRP